MNANGVQVMVNNKDLIKAVFDDDIMKYNKWFFKADWKNVKISRLAGSAVWSHIKNIVWKNGTWEKGVWKHGSWYNGIWKDGTWYQGVWYKGSWEKGTWKEGKIWDFNNKEYIKSTVPPNKCKWSLSYGK